MPYSKNARTLSDKQRGDLEASITKFGLAEIPAVNTDNVIVSGHQRLKILLALGKGDFILSNSMSYGRPYILDIDGAIHDGWAAISDFEEKVNSNFLYYFLSSTIVQNYWDSKINSGSVSNLNSDIIKTLQIPIPPIEEQKRIVSILDKFDALVNDISIGLPAELKARRQQYEYYRGKLLTFKPLSK
ncbi:restriction endonuclease subunit S [Patescibacteria group bacterium]|nr:restriction endonuclease subunit S [Patescibacteria group bacterium]